MNFIKDYISILVVIVGSSLAYIYGRRNNNFTTFSNQAKENLESLLEPMYLRLKYILNIEDEYEKEVNLNRWFNDYTSYKIHLHKLGDRSIIENFLQLESLYKSLNNNNTSEKELFYQQLTNMYIRLEKQYWSVFNSLYRDYYWYNRILNTNFPYRVFLECIKFLRNLVQLLGSTSGIIVFFSFYFKVLKVANMENEILIPRELTILAMSTLLLSVLIMICCEPFIPGKLMSLSRKVEGPFLKMCKKILSPFKCFTKIR